MPKEFLVPVPTASDEDAVIDKALAFAGAHDARLTLYVPAAIPTPMASPWGLAADTMIAELYGTIEREAHARADGLRQRLRDVDAAWDIRVGRARFSDPSLTFAQEARCADLAIVGQPHGVDASNWHDYFSATLFESGRPVLVLPRRGFEPKPIRRVLLGWKPTKECARAVHDALAQFAATQADVMAVDVVVVDEGDNDPERGADVAAHLAHRGLAVTKTAMPAAGKSVATTLLLHAAATGADLLVVGGYGHSRLREWVLGGATRDLLEQLELPVLFSR
ncbi:universal stress protein [Lysobacter sp. A6]|uniref:Universal stress protein n=1 Tax=Noviluteimonas lactosilytica TaxID=2888523 RepID=A0ABS8JJE5_9GAMM|nr:universal stress protein [Lysobacter lactosilyticus]MCC8363722.1 universal stress protein [Lysobacter lactosilyticus]